MRVYFLGAGASKSFYPGSPDSKLAQFKRLGLPTASELTLNHLLNASHYETPPCHEIESLRSFAHLQQADRTLLDAPVENVLDIFDRHEDQFRNLRICLVSRLWVRDLADTRPLVEWLRLVRNLRAVLLTTNYDTVLERGIGKLTRGVDGRHRRDRGLMDYGVESSMLFEKYQGVARGASPNSILLLKLHGSISWGYCKMCQKAVMDPAYRGLAEDALSGTATCPECSGPLLPILVGPAKKSYDQPIIETIYASAKRILEVADEIVFAGFSLNRGDKTIKELLFRSHQIARTSRVFVIDNSDDDRTRCELKARYREVYGDALQEIIPTDWRQYLVQQMTQTDIQDRRKKRKQS